MKTTRQYLLEALLYVREKPKMEKSGICTHVHRYMARAYKHRDYVNKLLEHYINQWPVVMEEANTQWSPIPFFWEESAKGTLWANPLRHELLNWLIERIEEDEKNGAETPYGLGQDDTGSLTVD